MRGVDIRFIREQSTYFIVFRQFSVISGRFLVSVTTLYVVFKEETLVRNTKKALQKISRYKTRITFNI